MGTLDADTEVLVIRELTNGWMEVRCSLGESAVEGYISGEYLSSFKTESDAFEGNQNEDITERETETETEAVIETETETEAETETETETEIETETEMAAESQTEGGSSDDAVYLSVINNRVNVRDASSMDGQVQDLLLPGEKVAVPLRRAGVAADPV